MYTCKIYTHKCFSLQFHFSQEVFVDDINPPQPEPLDYKSVTAKDFFDIGYYTNITERLSSSICGDVTDIGRWVLFGHIFPGPSFDMLAYSGNSAFGQ